MKIIFNRSAISSAVAPLMCAVSGKSTLTAIEGILVEAKIPDTCTLTTFDLEKGVRITVEAKVIEEGSYIINAQKFTQTLRVMEGEEVTLTVDEKHFQRKILSQDECACRCGLSGDSRPRQRPFADCRAGGN